MASATFELEDILSVSTGRLISEMAGIYKVMSHLVGRDLYTHELPAHAEQCKEEIKRQVPALDSPEMMLAEGKLSLMLDSIGEVDKPLLIIGWVSALKCGKYGVQLPSQIALSGVECAQ